MANVLSRKLQSFQQLTHDDLQAVEGLCADVHELQAGQDLIVEGGRPNYLHLGTRTAGDADLPMSPRTADAAT